MLNNINYTLHKMPRAILVLIACVPIAIIGVSDYSTNFDFSISFFYLAPIIFATWYIDLTAGITLSVMSTIIWLATSAIALPSQGISMWVLVLESAIRLGLFLVGAILIAQLHRSLNRERGLARTDYLTGILNSRAFREQANIELARAKRSQRPFTIIYFELDNFKEINERFGHAQGDKVLQFIGRELSRFLRVTDIIGRMGGEEFVVLFSETDQQNAYSVVARLYSFLTAEIRKKKWPITISMGVLTCIQTTIELDKVLHEVDKMMYESKKSEENRITYRVMVQDN